MEQKSQTDGVEDAVSTLCEALDEESVWLRAMAKLDSKRQTAVCALIDTPLLLPPRHRQILLQQLERCAIQYLQGCNLVEQKDILGRVDSFTLAFYSVRRWFHEYLRRSPSPETLAAVSDLLSQLAPSRNMSRMCHDAFWKFYDDYDLPGDHDDERMNELENASTQDVIRYVALRADNGAAAN